MEHIYLYLYGVWGTPLRQRVGNHMSHPVGLGIQGSRGGLICTALRLSGIIPPQTKVIIVEPTTRKLLAVGSTITSTNMCSWKIL